MAIANTPIAPSGPDALPAMIRAYDDTTSCSTSDPTNPDRRGAVARYILGLASADECNPLRMARKAIRNALGPTEKGVGGNRAVPPPWGKVYLAAIRSASGRFAR